MENPRREQDDGRRGDDADGEETAMRACELHAAIVRRKPSRTAHGCVPMSTLRSVVEVTLVPWGPADRPFVHAFPSVANGPSNALCRKLGFALVEERDFEYPKGHFMRCNDWQLDLFG